MSYRELFYRLINNHILKIIVIIGPPRSSTTTLEGALFFNEEVKLNIHEPFSTISWFKKGKEDVYKNILDQIIFSFFQTSVNRFNRNRLLELFINGIEKNKKPYTVVIKEMTHQIGNEYKKLFQSVDGPVLVIIRNPILSYESRVKRVIIGCYDDINDVLQHFILKEIAKKFGYSDCKTLLTVDKFLAESLFGEYFSYLKKASFKSKSINLKINFQRHILNIYARFWGFKDWSEFQQLILSTKKYFLIDKLLTKIFPVLRTGWQQNQLKKQLNFLIKNKINFYIIDSTDLRENPGKITSIICSKLGLKYCKKMIKWGVNNEKMKKFDTGDLAEFNWYSRFTSSKGIQPPSETAINTSLLPKYLKIDLEKNALPQYISLKSNLYHSFIK